MDLVKATKSELDINTSIITATLPEYVQTVQKMGTFAQMQEMTAGGKIPIEAIANNGIIKEGGVTELYETTTTQQNATTLYIASNGSIVKLFNTGAAGNYVTNIYVNDGIKDNYIGQTSSIFYKRYLAPKQYYDVVASSDNVHGLGIYGDSNGIYIDEFLLTTQVVTQTQTVTASYNFNTIYNAVICRTNTLTFASAISTSGFILCQSSTTNQYIYVKNGVVYNANSLTGGVLIREQADNLTAFYNGGTVIFSALNATTPAIYSMVSPYTATTITQFNGVNGATLGTRYSQPLDPSQTTLYLVASGCNSTNDYGLAFGITISATGVVAVVTEVGNTVPTFGGTVGSTAVTSAVTCPYGTAGLAHNSTPNYGQWNQSSWTLNNNVSASNAGAYAPELIAPVIVTLNGGAIKMAIEVKSYKQLISMFTGRQITGLPTNQYTGNMINDFGGGLYNFDIMGGSTWNTTNTANVFMPFDYRNETVPGNGAWMIYKRNDRKFILCQFTYNDNIQFTEIGRGIVSLNNMYSNNSIIDTINLIGYDNCSGYSNSFQFNFTSNLTSMGYFRKYNLYSSSLDAGLMYFDTSVSCPHFTTLCGGLYSYYPNDFVIWNGASGAYVKNCSQTTLYYNGQYSGTYTNSAYVPPANDAVFINGGIQLFSVSAFAQPNYFGYQLANLFPIKYKNFFELRGFWYIYDGTYIFEVPLPNGQSSSLGGAVPLPLVTAQGMKYLDSSPEYAFFLDSFDNSLWIFSGGRDITKSQAFNMKSPIQYGVYNDFENALYMVTTSSIIIIRDQKIITENTLPWGVPYTNFNIYNTEKGIYFVQGLVVKTRSYYPPTLPAPAFSTVANIANWGKGDILCSATNGTNVYVGGTNGAVGVWNGTAWSIIQVTGWMGDILSIASDTSTNVIVGGSYGQYAYSTNSGLSFSSPLSIAGIYNDITSIVSTATSTFHLFSYNGAWTYTSNSGSTWTTVTNIAGWTGQYIASSASSGASNIIIVGDNGYSSTWNGTSWTTASAITGITSNINSIIYNPGGTQWILAGDAGLVAYSSDGATWTVQSVGTNNYTSVSIYNLHNYIVTSQTSGTYIYSSTPIPSWTSGIITGWSGSINTSVFATSYYFFGINGQYASASISFVFNTPAVSINVSSSTFTDIFCYQNTWIAVGQYYDGTNLWAGYSISTDNGTTWTPITGFPNWKSNDYDIANSIFCYQGTWIAIGSHYDGTNIGGVYSISTNNGTTWSTIAGFPGWINNHAANKPNSLFCYNGTWIAVGQYWNGSSNIAVYSISTNNGASWSTIAGFPGWNNTYGSMPKSIFCYNGTWITVGYDYTGSVFIGVYTISTNNGASWSSRTSFPGFNVEGNNSINSIFYYQGTWIAVGSYYDGTNYNGVYSISINNGASWSSIATFPGWYAYGNSYDSANSIFCYQGMWFVIGLHYPLGSTETVYSISTNNGASWTTMAPFSGWTNTGNGNSIFCYNGTWIAVGVNNNEATYIKNSIVTTFSSASTLAWSSGVPHTIINNNSTLYAYGNKGYITSSAIDNIWSTPVSITSNDILTSLSNNNQILIGGKSGYFAYSPNGTSYTQVTISGWIGNIYCLSAMNNTIIAVGDYGQYATSTNNGISFGTTSIISGWVGNIYSVINNGSIWLVTGSNGQVALSSNGITWTISTIAGWTGSIYCSTYLNQTWLIGGYNGQYAYSTNSGSTWTVATLSGMTNILQFQLNGNEVLAVGNNSSTSAYSYSMTNGQTWSTPVSIPGWTSNGILYDATLKNNEFTIVGINNLLPSYSISNATGSAIIPLNYQTGYFGWQYDTMYSMNRIHGRIYCKNQTSTPLTLTWNWVTQDSSGQDTTTITTTPLSQTGYYTFEWTPPDSNVIAGSIGISTTDTIQKITLLNLDVYTTYANEANISNKAP